MLQCSSATAPILLQQLQQPVIVAFAPQLMESHLSGWRGVQLALRKSPTQQWSFGAFLFF